MSGRKVSDCIHLIDVQFSYTGLQGVEFVPSYGITVVADNSTSTKLEAHHETGKNVDFSSSSLRQFLRSLADKGVGVIEKFEEVEYEYGDIHRGTWINGEYVINSTG